MDPSIQTLALQLSEVAVRNTAGKIFDRIKIARTRKNNEESIAELEAIIYELIDDKAELSRIAQAFEEALVAQRISETEIDYIAETVVPLVEEFIDTSTDQSVEEEKIMQQQQQMLDALKSLLSVETITVLQLLGFNFKQAIGEPLTTLIAQNIGAKTPLTPADEAELEKIKLQQNIALVETARDLDAWNRLTRGDGLNL